MTTVPVRCPEPGCGEIVEVDKSLHDGSDQTELLNVRCRNGHVFDYDKSRCPRCGSPMIPAEVRSLQGWFGDTTPDRTREFHPATCTSGDCDYEGPKK